MYSNLNHELWFYILSFLTISMKLVTYTLYKYRHFKLRQWKTLKMSKSRRISESLFILSNVLSFSIYLPVILFGPPMFKTTYDFWWQTSIFLFLSIICIISDLRYLLKLIW